MAKKIPRVKQPDVVDGAALTKVAEAISALIKVKDDKLGPIAQSLKAELGQLIRDAKSGAIAQRPSAVKDFYDRVDEAIGSANEILEKLEDEPEEEETPSGPWTFQTAELDAPPDMKLAKDDLEDLLKRAGNLYATQTGTVVGGKSIKGKGKKIDGLNYGSARIDVQVPPKKGLHNVQFQIGEESVACVVFADTDAEKEVKENLRESLRTRKKAVSPAALAAQKKA